jgi:hypothetical protein
MKVFYKALTLVAILITFSGQAVANFDPLECGGECDRFDRINENRARDNRRKDFIDYECFRWDRDGWCIEYYDDDY